MDKLERLIYDELSRCKPMAPKTVYYIFFHFPLFTLKIFASVSCLFAFFFLVYMSLVPSSPPAAVVVANQSSTSVSVSWRRVPKEHRRGKIIAYVVKITDVSTETSTEKVYNDSNILNVTIDGLKKYTLYRVTVSAKTSKGASNASREYKLRTAEDGK